MGLEITLAGPGDIDGARLLFREYEAWLSVDLCFQNFEEELSGLPGRYAPPRGRLYIAREGRDLAGCVALRPFDAERAELKRLYVRERFRGKGSGQALLERVINDAHDIGYSGIVLDTIYPRMAKAVELYRSHGFIETSPYYHNPHDGVVFMELRLDR
jgi:putative acetyltransferase